MSAHWPEYLKEVSGVLSGLQIVTLRKVALVPGYVRKTHLILTNEIATEPFKLSSQPQFCLHLNRYAVHTSRNNGDLIKQTHRERRLRVLPIFSGRPAICWTAVARGPIWLCAFGPAVLLGSTPRAAASLHIILAIFTAAGLTKLSPAVKGGFALAFSKQQINQHALLYYGSKFLLLK